MSPDWSSDPDAVPYADLENPQTLNLYGYVGNKPLSMTDPDGHFMLNQSPTCWCEGAAQGILTLWYDFQWNWQNNWFKSKSPVPPPPVVTPAQTANPNPNPNNQNQNGKNKLSRKIQNQMAKRGWTEQSIDQTTSQPVHTSASQNMATGNAATAYFNADGSYVVVDDVTNEVTQISDRTKPNWVPDSRIVDPYKP